jgi:hypothetical protein
MSDWNYSGPANCIDAANTTKLNNVSLGTSAYNGNETSRPGFQPPLPSLTSSSQMPLHPESHARAHFQYPASQRIGCEQIPINDSSAPLSPVRGQSLLKTSEPGQLMTPPSLNLMDLDRGAFSKTYESTEDDTGGSFDLETAVTDYWTNQLQHGYDVAGTTF